MKANARPSGHHSVNVALLGALSALATFDAPALTRDQPEGFPTTRMGCLIGSEPYAFHFSLLLEQPSRAWPGKFDNYCQEVPTTGTLYLSIDLLDREARTKPIALRVVAESLAPNGHSVEEKSTLLEIPEKVYASGTAEARVDIVRPGHYALIAIVAEASHTKNVRLRIPFSVAVSHPLPAAGQNRGLAQALALLFLSIMLFIAYCVHRGGTGALAKLVGRWLKTHRPQSPDQTA